MMKDRKQIVYSRNTLELVTVGVEFCAYMEQSGGRKCSDFVDTILKLLPLLYLKASLLEAAESEDDFIPEAFVTEADYDYVRSTLASIMGEQDDYLDFYNEDDRFIDEPVARTVSEDLADLYQAVKNFTETYKLGLDDNMFEAVVAAKEGFELYWGQTLVNVMRALHRVKYALRETDDNECDCDDDDCCGHHHYGHCE